MGDAPNVYIRPLEQSDIVTGIEIGDDRYSALKIFLETYAKSLEVAQAARTYAAFASDERGERVVGYVTLVCAVLDTGKDVTLRDRLRPPGVDNYPYAHYPAVKIARLLVDERYRGLGLGDMMVSYAKGVASRFIAPRVGCCFVLVDSKKDAIGFYQKLQFRLLDTQDNQDKAEPLMVFELPKTENALQAIRNSEGGYLGD